MKKPILLILGLFLSFLSVVAQDYTVFSFDNVQPANVGSWSDTFVSAPNPTKDAVNGTDNAGLYTHKSAWSDVSINTTSIDTRIYTSYEIKYYSPYATSGAVSIACFNGNTQLDWFEPQVTAAGVWVKVTRPIAFGQKITRVMIAFRRSSGADPIANNNLIYFDDFVFKKSAGPDYTLYNENFRAGYPWYDGTQTIAPSTRNGRWSGGINATTPSDASITLVKNWDVDRERELLLAPSAAVTSSGPVVSFSGVDLAGFDNLEFQIGAAWPNVAAQSADFNNVSLDAALKTPKVELQTGTGSWVSIPLIPLVAEVRASSVQTFDLSTYALGSNVTTMNIRLTSAPNLTTVFYDMKITGRIPTGPTTDIVSEKVQKINFYPNPAKDFISFNSKINQVTIYDLQGHEVLNVLNPTKIDVRNLKSGIYILNAKASNEVFNSKLIIE